MKIILTTMVRNESKALPRLIRSAAGLVDAIALTDTGSTDNTPAIAEALCKELGVPVTIYHDTWSDFGTNRTKNLEHGRLVAAGLGPASECFMLLMDADMEIPQGTPRPEELPILGMLDQSDGRATWSNVRVLRADLPATYVGRTHEYVSHAGAPITKLTWFKIMDHCDGGCRSDKFERDERLLRLDLAEKNDSRSRFYLAQSLQNMGRKKEAIQYYDERAKVEDFPEEAYMARLEAARCSEGPEADQRAWEAFYSRPKRAEPLADIARRAADQGRHRTAMAVAAIGKQIPMPTDELLYLNRESYQFPFAYAEMISGYYTGQRELGIKACEFLHFCHGSPWAAVGLDNAVFYMETLPGTRRPLPFVAPPGFAPASPCLLKVPGGWVGMIRGVNYEISASGHFPLIGGGWADAEHPITTRNFVVWYDDDFQVTREPLELRSPRSPVARSLIVGFEDQRIVRYDPAAATLITAGVRCDASPQGIPEIWEATWSLNDGACVADRRISSSPHCEKNWLPFEGGYLYGHHPTVSFRDANGAYAGEVAPGLNLSGFRGSAAPIPYRDGFLYVVHEVSARGRRIYMTRFVYATRTSECSWRIESISRPFKMFGEPCMESCFSVNLAGDSVVLSCAHEDREVYTITTPKEVVDGLLAAGTPGHPKEIQS